MALLHFCRKIGARSAALAAARPLLICQQHNAVSRRTFAAAAPAAADRDMEIDRHFVSHELAFPFTQPPKDDKDLEKATQDIWDRSGKNPLQITETVKVWMKEGNKVSRELVDSLLIRMLARYRVHIAYTFFNWVVIRKPYDLTDEDTLRLLYLASLRKQHRSIAIFKLLGEKEKPDEAYQWILNSYAGRNLRAEAEALFENMKNENRVSTAEPYNIMIKMYLRLDEVEMAKQVFSELEASPLKPTSSTYKALLSYNGPLGMKGFKDKMEAFLDKHGDTKQLRGNDWENCILLYAAVGKPAMIQKLWTEMKSGGYVPDKYYLAAAEAFGKIGDMNKFEQLCTEVVSRSGELSVEQCFLMLKVYTEQGQMEKAEAIAGEVTKGGFRTYHFLIAGYLKSGHPNKAAEKMKEALDKASTLGPFSVPMYFTVLLAMEAFEKARDLEGAQKLDHCIQQEKNKRSVDVRYFNALLKVYLAAKSPVSGIEERMRDLKVIPSNETNRLLAEVSAFSTPTPNVAA